MKRGRAKTFYFYGLTALKVKHKQGRALVGHGMARVRHGGPPLPTPNNTIKTQLMFRTIAAV